jgi:hypothetical protein
MKVRFSPCGWLKKQCPVTQQETLCKLFIRFNMNEWDKRAK